MKKILILHDGIGWGFSIHSVYLNYAIWFTALERRDTFLDAVFL